MKKKMINKYILSLVALLTLGLTSCEEFLTVLPTNSITEEDFFTEKGDLDNVRAAAYQKLATSDIVSRILYWGEVRSDNFELNNLSNTGIMYVRDGVLQPTESMFDWSSYYTGINYCNKVLEKGQYMVDNNVDPSFNANDWRTLKAEIISLRALYYFYLVKAYRNVPLAMASISTDEEAKKSEVPATSGEVILDSLINQLEEYKDFAAINFGNSRDNKGRFTRRSMRTLLADIYLWRGCMLKNHADKYADGYVVDSLGTADSINTLSTTCFDKAIAHVDYVLADMMKDYLKEKENSSQSMGNSGREYSEFYPLIIYKLGNQNVVDQVYAEIWGAGNSLESIFDIQYDGTENRNTAVASYFSSFSTSGGLSPGALKVNPAFFTTAMSGENESTLGFGKTDTRLLQTAFFEADEVIYPYHKNIATSFAIVDPEDMTEGFAGNPAYRESDKTNMCQPIYHLSDLMLIKAEALARKAATGDDLAEGFKLVNTLFARYNPKLVAASAAGSSGLGSVRLNEDYATDKTASDLLTLVYRERQREFVGEGKRWFDLVREAEFNNSTKPSLDMMSASSSVQTRLRHLWGMYVPVYSEELKANTQLVQNPVWDKYSEK